MKTSNKKAQNKVFTLLVQKRSKAQSAMEFLMTYGWALLVVLIVIGALAFFGILNPDRFLPDTCTMGTPGLHCTDYVINSTHVTLFVKNNLGQDIKNFNITIIDINSYYSSGGASSGEAVRFDINYSYQTTTAGITLDHAGKGELRGVTTQAITGAVVENSGHGAVTSGTTSGWAYAASVPQSEAYRAVIPLEGD